MRQNTIVSACDVNYAWGMWLLVASMRKNGMNEPFLVGAYNWPKAWRMDMEKFSNCQVIELPINDKRSVTCSKPEIMLHAQTPFVTWVDCDGVFSGNCSSQFCHNKDDIYIRQRSQGEVHALYKKQRRADEPKDTVPEAILNIWQKDVAQAEKPHYSRGISAALIHLSTQRKDFLELWKSQMLKVLPQEVSLVDDHSIAYFQTDESVLNSLLLYATTAPSICKNYRSDRVDGAHFIHFGYNPKPWIMWNRNAFKHFDLVQEILEWGRQNNLLPQATKPFPLCAKNRFICQLGTYIDRPIAYIRKHIV